MTRADRFTCEEVFQRLDVYLDRELDPEEMRLVREHLETCRICASEYRFERRVLDSVREKVRRISMPAELLGRVQAAIARGRADSAG